MMVPVRNEPDAAPACHASTDIQPRKLAGYALYWSDITCDITEELLISR